METKMINCDYICLFTDLWSNISNSDFLGLSVATIDEHFNREFFTLYLKKLTEAHTAEYIAHCIETIINKFDDKEFDKKNHGNYC